MIAKIVLTYVIFMLFSSIITPRYYKTLLHLQSRWDDHELLFVIGRGNSLEGLEPLEGVLSTLSLVGGHATHLHNNSKLYQW